MQLFLQDLAHQSMMNHGPMRFLCSRTSRISTNADRQNLKKAPTLLVGKFYNSPFLPGSVFFILFDLIAMDYRDRFEFTIAARFVFRPGMGWSKISTDSTGQKSLHQAGRPKGPGR